MYFGWPYDRYTGRTSDQLMAISCEFGFNSSHRGLFDPLLATLSDGEETIASALKSCRPQAHHKRCQRLFLGNLVQEVLKKDDQLRPNELGSLTGSTIFQYE